MKEHYDPWFIRLPDGRTIKAKSTASVRHHVEAGHIPLNSMVRRDPDEQWVALVWVAEFADLASPWARAMAPPPAGRRHQAGRPGPASRPGSTRCGCTPWASAGSSTNSSRPSTARRPDQDGAGLRRRPARVRRDVRRPRSSPPVGVRARTPSGCRTCGVAFAVLVLSVLNALLARLTHMEVSTMRPARLGTELAGLSRFAGSATVANALVAGGAFVGHSFCCSHVPGLPPSEARKSGSQSVSRRPTQPHPDRVT